MLKIDCGTILTIGQLIIDDLPTDNNFEPIYKKPTNIYRVDEVTYKAFDLLNKTAGKQVDFIDVSKEFDCSRWNDFIFRESSLFTVVENDKRFLLPKNLLHKNQSSVLHLDKFVDITSNLVEMLIKSKHVAVIAQRYNLTSSVIKNVADLKGLKYKKINMVKYAALSKLKRKFENLFKSAPYLIHLKYYAETSFWSTDEITEFFELNCLNDIHVVFSFEKESELTEPLASKLNYRMKIPTLNLKEREEALEIACASLNLPSNLPAILAPITVGANFATLSRLLKEPLSDDLEKLTETFKEIQKSTGELSSVSIPKVRWEDVGGLEEAKTAIIDTIQLPLKFPKLFKSSMFKRSGLLFYGPPGSGKTLLAKAIANECSMNFISVKGPELLNMYVGESEKNIRDTFEKARMNSPCVLFFDEIDALVPARSKNSDSENVMDRMVSAFMAEMDDLAKENIICVASTNRPDLLDGALLRPGRFEKKIFIGLPEKSDLIKVFEANCRKFKFEEEIDFSVLAQKCKRNFSGADVYSVCVKAFGQAIKRAVSQESDIQVRKSDFEGALLSVEASVSEKDMKQYEKMKFAFENN